MSTSKIGVESNATELLASIEHTFHINTLVGSACSEAGDIESGQISATIKHGFHDSYIVRLKCRGKHYGCQIIAILEHAFRSPQNIVYAIVLIVKEGGKIVDGNQIGAAIEHFFHGLDSLDVGV
jgi:hypothetical protein